MGNFKLLAFLLLFSQFFGLFSDSNIKIRVKSNFEDFRESDFSVIDFYFKENSDTNIAILKYVNNNKFILKQILDNSVFAAVVREKVAADIARAVGIGVNEVTIISAHRSFPGKKIFNKPATLHAFVPGVAVRLLFGKGYGPNIRQYRSAKGNGKRGLSRITIKDMASHSDLSALVAFDTFTANHDRHQRNYFYDEASDHFFAIDLECSFSTNIAQHAYNLFYDMVKNGDKSLSLNEINGLIIYQSMLKKLIKMYPPKIIYSAVNKSIDEVDIKFDKKNYNFLKKMQSAIQTNYDSCEKTVAILDVLLKSYK